MRSTEGFQGISESLEFLCRFSKGGSFRGRDLITFIRFSQGAVSSKRSRSIGLSLPRPRQIELYFLWAVWRHHLWWRFGGRGPPSEPVPARVGEACSATGVRGPGFGGSRHWAESRPCPPLAGPLRWALGPTPGCCRMNSVMSVECLAQSGTHRYCRNASCFLIIIILAHSEAFLSSPQIH